MPYEYYLQYQINNETRLGVDEFFTISLSNTSSAFVCLFSLARSCLHGFEAIPHSSIPYNTLKKIPQRKYVKIQNYYYTKLLCWNDGRNLM